MMNVKRLVLVAVALACGMGWSMPSKADLKTAEKKAAELMRSDLEALKAGSQTKLGMGETAYVLAEQAKDEATRCVLLSGALHYFVAAGEAARADAAFRSLRTGVADLPPSFVADLLARELSGRKGTGCLFEALEHARRQVAYMKEAEQLVAELRKFPGNSVARRRLAECRALAGDWPAALAAFAELKGERARDVAVCERHPATAEKKLPAAEIAAFWWSYPTDNPDGRLTGFKVHAADWYRKALAGQAADGLDGLLMQKRVAFVDSPAPTQFAVAKKPQPKKPERAVAEAEKPAGPIPAVPATIAALPRKFTLKNRSVLELLPVPAGSVRLKRSNGESHYYWGDDRNPDHEQEVKISRPFWMARSFISRDEWFSEMKRKPDDNLSQKVFYKGYGGGGMAVAGKDGMDAETCRQFCEKLTRRFKNRIPAGYVFRLPTISELWYVRKLSFPDFDEGVKGSWEQYKPYLWSEQRQKALFASTGAPKNEERFAQRVPGPDKLPQDERGFTGLFVAGSLQWTLDTCPPTARSDRYSFCKREAPDSPFSSIQGTDARNISFYRYRHELTETDHLDFCPPNACSDATRLYSYVETYVHPPFAIWMVAMSMRGTYVWHWPYSVFRIVLAPDLEAERKGK